MNFNCISERISFPPQFEFYAHENGFNIKHKENYYSLIINSQLVIGKGRYTGHEIDKWELRDAEGSIKTFEDMRQASAHIIRTEGYIPETLDLQTFYNLKGENVE